MSQRICKVGAVTVLGLLSGCVGFQQQRLDPMDPKGTNLDQPPRVVTPLDTAKELDELLRAIGKFGKNVAVTSPLFFKCGCVGDVTTAIHTVQRDCDGPMQPPCDPDKLSAEDVKRGLDVFAAALEAEAQGREVKIGP